MSFEKSAAFEEAVSWTDSLSEGSARERGALVDRLRDLFTAFGETVTDAQIRRVCALMNTLAKDEPYGFSVSRLCAVAEYLHLIFSQERSEKVCADGAALLRQILCDAQSDDVNSGTIASFCIKTLFPAIYDIGTQRPVEPKLLFMQPRRGLNETFRYLYKRLEQNYPYTLTLYEFHRDTVSSAEYYVNASFFMRDMATAHTVFVHESNNLMGYLTIRPETKIVQLWHGCGVFKHIGLSTAGKDGFKSLEKYMEFPEYNNYSIVTIASPELTWVFEEFMGIPREKGIIQPLGVCRTDEFFDHGYVEKCYKKLYKAIPAAKDKKVILYAPTYRGVDPHRVSPDELDIEQFARELGDDYVLIMKHHQTVKTLPQIPESCRDKFAYDMTRGKGMNINELMTVADVCITDYSSVAFEFSLFERPLLFFVYDLDEYIDNRGLYYNFDEITPGPLCRTTGEMVDYIKGLKNGFDSTEVTDFKKRFMCSCDGHACDRTIQFIGLDTVDVWYNGNGADGVTESTVMAASGGTEKADPSGSVKNTDSPAMSGDHGRGGLCRTFVPEIVRTAAGALRVRRTASLPVTEYRLAASPFTREAYAFTGWQLYQMEQGLKYWYCDDNTWRTDDELRAAGRTRRIFADQENITGLTARNNYALHFDAQWTPHVTLSTLPAYVKSLNLKRKCKNVVKKILGR